MILYLFVSLLEKRRALLSKIKESTKPSDAIVNKLIQVDFEISYYLHHYFGKDQTSIRRKYQLKNKSSLGKPTEIINLQKYKGVIKHGHFHLT